MIQNVYKEESQNKDDMELFMIQANDLDQSELADEEFQQFIAEAQIIESHKQEEEKKQEFTLTSEQIQKK